MKALFFPWPAGPGEVRELGSGIKTIQEHVQGSFEAHTLANGCVVYCHELGRSTFKGEAYRFPYIGFDLPPPDDDGFKIVMFDSYEQMLATPKRAGVIDVYGPCIVVGQADEDGEETDITDEEAAFIMAVAAGVK